MNIEEILEKIDNNGFVQEKVLVDFLRLRDISDLNTRFLRMSDELEMSLEGVDSCWIELVIKEDKGYNKYCNLHLPNLYCEIKLGVSSDCTHLEKNIDVSLFCIFRLLRGYDYHIFEETIKELAELI